ncbi:uncharacterized protein NECHADRAFT_52518, partial [Fusarium vanettenii 77-13-4]
MDLTDSLSSLDESGPVIASGKRLALSTKLRSKFFLVAPADADPWFGFTLDFPLGQDQAANEDSGFGIRHEGKASGDAVVPVDNHRLTIRFPRGGFQTIVEDATLPLMNRFPNAKRRDHGMTVLKVVIGDASVSIQGFGYPFANVDDLEVEGWVNNKPIVDGHTLIDILRSKRFVFVLPKPVAAAAHTFNPDRLPAPFSYPYGPNQEWNLPLYRALIAQNKGHRFIPAFRHPDDLSHITSVVQAAVQDVLWIDDAVNEILAIRFPAYFVSPETSASEPRAVEGIKQFYIVVALTPQFRTEYDSAWRRLIKAEGFRVRLFNSHESLSPHETWNCKIVEYPSNLSALKPHPVRKHELVLCARRPTRDEFQKKQPYEVKMFPDRNGFYDWMVKPDPRSTNAPPMLRALPSINFLDIEDKAYANAIVAEALPQDQARFRGYLSNRPLGLAAATLAMHAKLGKILCSAPTNVAVDNFASRLDTRTRTVVERYNRGLQGGQPRRRHTFVVRAYRPEHESVAFKRLLQDSRISDGAAPKPFARRPSKWRLHLSCAFWLLVLLRSPAVRGLHPDDSPVLHEMQQAIHDHDSTVLLRDVATGAITWEQFKEADGYTRAMTVANDLLAYIPDQADLLVARGVSIDEAANMHRADLYCVWGNTLLPCFLFGDPKQLSPTVMTNSEQHKAVLHRDDEGDVDMESEQNPVGFLNRFAMDGKISALQYLQGNGIPVYR